MPPSKKDEKKRNNNKNKTCKEVLWGLRPNTSIKKISQDSDAPDKKFRMNTKEPEGAWLYFKAESRREPDLVPLNHAGIGWIKMMRDWDQNTLAVTNHSDQTTANIINLCRQANNTYYAFRFVFSVESQERHAAPNMHQTCDWDTFLPGLPRTPRMARV